MLVITGRRRLLLSPITAFSVWEGIKKNLALGDAGITAPLPGADALELPISFVAKLKRRYLPPLRDCKERLLDL